MKRVINYERGSGGNFVSLLLIVVGIVVVWLIWEAITSALGSGIEEQRRRDREMMQMGLKNRATPRPVNHGGIKNRNVTF